MKPAVEHPELGGSFGLHFPFMYREEGPFFLVYLRASGLIVHRFAGAPRSRYGRRTRGERRCEAEWRAREACMRLNGITGADVRAAGIAADATP
jgi:hypothetical protein